MKPSPAAARRRDRTRDEEIIINEINPLWGGSLVPDIVGQRLIGARYVNQQVISAAQDVPPVPLADALKLLNAYGTQYAPEPWEGVVVLAYDAWLEYFPDVPRRSWRRSRVSVTSRPIKSGPTQPGSS